MGEAANFDGVRSRRPLWTIVLVLAALALLWTGWAATSLRLQRAYAERMASEVMVGRGAETPEWRGLVDVRSAQARLDGISSVLPPSFYFTVTVNATMQDGTSRRGTVSVGRTGDRWTVVTPANPDPTQ